METLTIVQTNSLAQARAILTTGFNIATSAFVAQEEVRILLAATENATRVVLPLAKQSAGDASAVAVPVLVKLTSARFHLTDGDLTLAREVLDEVVESLSALLDD